MPSLDKHTLRRLARSTLNELQQNQHEKASLDVCVFRARQDWHWCRVRWVWSTKVANYDVESHRHGAEKCFIFYFWQPTHARTTRYEEAFLPEGKKRPRSLRSLGLASLKSSSRVQFSPSAHTRRDFFSHKN